MEIHLTCSMQSANLANRQQNKDQPKFVFLFEEPKYDTFFKDFLLSNVPCILSCGMMGNWNACKDWMNHTGEPDLGDLCNKFGEMEVPVANCSERLYDSQPKSQQKLKEYVTYMKRADRQGSLYLKDWHLQREDRRLRPEDESFYRTPSLVASDWLNEFWEARPEREDDYRFVYVGVEGTWTPFHADVFRSFSWSANVCGAKRWILLPPGEQEKLRSFAGLPYDVASVLDAESPDEATGSAQLHRENECKDGLEAAALYPRTSPNGVRYFDVRQEAGEMIFVPSGWHHQVWNLRDTISINHNWFNAANIHLVCDHLLASLAAVRAELADIADDSDEFLAQCQTLLRATHGMDLKEFAELLCFTIERRLEALRVDRGAVLGLDGWEYGRRHLLFDVRSAGQVLRRLTELEEFSRLEELQRWSHETERLLEEAEVLGVTLDGSKDDGKV